MITSTQTVRPPKHAFTVDVEDYFHVTAFEGCVPRCDWSRFESRVEWSTRRLLELLGRHNARATFFVLGWVAEAFPQLVREIDQAGHEIGSHSYWHRLVYHLEPEKFRQDLRLSKHVLEDITGKRVTLYRAPSFSITNRSLWALDILAEEGFLGDSSIFPIRRIRYGVPRSRRDLYRVETKAGPLWEFPPTVWRLARLNLPMAGGGYFRLYPGAVTRFALRRVSRTTQRPLMFYTHPWEVDPDQPRLNAGTRLARFRHYVNLGRTEKKLDKLLARFEFGCMGDVLAAEQPAEKAAVQVGELANGHRDGRRRGAVGRRQ